MDVCCDEWVGGQFWLRLLVGGLVGAGLGGLEWLAAYAGVAGRSG